MFTIYVDNNPGQESTGHTKPRVMELLRFSLRSTGQIFDGKLGHYFLCFDLKKYRFVDWFISSYVASMCSSSDPENVVCVNGREGREGEQEGGTPGGDIWIIV